MANSWKDIPNSEGEGEGKWASKLQARNLFANNIQATYGHKCKLNLQLFENIEQKGCYKNSRGIKDQLLIDKIGFNEFEKKKEQIFLWLR